MPRTQTKAIDLEYRLLDVGWANARVQAPGRPAIETAVSYATDALGELARATLLVCENRYAEEVSRRTTKRVPYAAEFRWEDEPGGWQWHLERTGLSRVCITIRPLSHTLPPRPGAVLVRVTVSLRDWIRIVTTLLEGVLREHGLAGYRTGWVEHEFPLALLLRLRTRQRAPRAGADMFVTKSSLAAEGRYLLRLAGHAAPGSKRRAHGGATR